MATEKVWWICTQKKNILRSIIHLHIIKHYSEPQISFKQEICIGWQTCTVLMMYVTLTVTPRVSVTSLLWSPSFLLSMVARSSKVCVMSQLSPVRRRSQPSWSSLVHSSTAWGTRSPERGQKRSSSTSGMKAATVSVHSDESVLLEHIAAGGKLEVMRTTCSRSPSVRVSEVVPITCMHVHTHTHIHTHTHTHTHTPNEIQNTAWSALSDFSFLTCPLSWKTC